MMHRAAAVVVDVCTTGTNHGVDNEDLSVLAHALVSMIEQGCDCYQGDAAQDVCDERVVMAALRALDRLSACHGSDVAYSCGWRVSVSNCVVIVFASSPHDPACVWLPQQRCMLLEWGHLKPYPPCSWAFR